jgi:hypothetical protein
MKNRPDPVAMDDSEYPDWLWGLLDDNGAGKGNPDGRGDTSGMFMCSSVSNTPMSKCLLSRSHCRKLFDA